MSQDMIATRLFQGAYRSILTPANQFGHTRKTRENSVIQICSELEEAGLIEIVEPTDDMLKHISFSSEESKQRFISDHIWITLTDKGSLAANMIEVHLSKYNDLQNKHRVAIKNLKKDIAERLLDSIGIEVEDLIEED